jgi:D-alanine-D-alanine ligase
VSDRYNILLLAGGDSSEQDVSLASARSILEALEQLGHGVTIVDPKNPDLSPEAVRDLVMRAGISQQPPAVDHGSGRARFMQLLERWDRLGADIVFNALHGGAGEDGTLQAIMEYLGIPYTGSGSRACALAMDKHVSRRLAMGVGVPVAEGFIADCNDATPDELQQRITRGPGFPAVVKPVDQGSSVGLTIVKSRQDLAGALERTAPYGSRFLVERYIAGTEITVTVLGEEALPALEIRPESGLYDYLHKYTSGRTEYICPAPLEDSLVRAFTDYSVSAYHALGCSVYARIDFRLSPSGEPFFLEVNTLPGMTAHSLVPKAARAAKIEFPELIDRIIHLSLREVRPKH